MIKTVKIFMQDSAFNYSTSVNFWATEKDLNDYFVGNTFFRGTCESQENDPRYNQRVTHIEIQPVLVRVISGAFQGEQGELKAGLNKNTFHVNGCLVTANQIEVL